MCPPIRNKCLVEVKAEKNPDLLFLNFRHFSALEAFQAFNSLQALISFYPKNLNYFRNFFVFGVSCDNHSAALQGFGDRKGIRSLSQPQ